MPLQSLSSSVTQRQFFHHSENSWWIKSSFTLHFFLIEYQYVTTETGGQKKEGQNVNWAELKTSYRKWGVCHLLDKVRRRWQGLNIQDLFSLTINYLFTKWNRTIIWQGLFTMFEHERSSHEHAHNDKNTKSGRAARLISHRSYILSWKRLLNRVQTRFN